MRVPLFDTFTLEGVERAADGRLRLVEKVGDGGGVRRTKDGYLVANAKVARSGIQVYGGSELGKPEIDLVKVYRSPEEVFNQDSMRTAAHRPVTLFHPPEMVNPDNWLKYSKGTIGDKIVRDGDHIQVPLVLMDGKTIKAIERDGIKELSAGYTTEIVWEPGKTPDGEAYDARQTKIEWNHLALVPEARGGPTLRLGDGSDDAMKCQDCGKTWVKDAKACDCGSTKFTTDQKTTPTNDALRVESKETTMAHSMILDGQPIEVADKLTASVIEKHSADLRKRVTDSETAAKAIADALETEKKAHAAALDAARKEVSAKDGEIVVLKKQVADSALSPDKLDALIADRAAVIDAATPMLEKGFVFAGKTIDDIRKAAVSAKLGDAAKDLDSAGIGGAFTALSAIKTTDGTTRLAGALSDHNRKTHDATNLTDAEVAYREMIKEMQAGRPARN